MKTAVFISGNGSNLQAIIDLWLTGKARYDLQLVSLKQGRCLWPEEGTKSGD